MAAGFLIVGFLHARLKMAKPDDILLSIRAPVGDINVAYEECCIGRGLSAIRSKMGCSSFFLYTMFAIRQQFEKFNYEGTVFSCINQKSLNFMPISIPPKENIYHFESIVNPIDSLIKKNYEENSRLKILRNSLILKLMPGELDVSEIEI